MIVSGPTSAPVEEPVTRASTIRIPRSVSLAPISRVADGPIVERSMHSVPGRAAARARLAEQYLLDPVAVDDHRPELPAGGRARRAAYSGISGPATLVYRSEILVGEVGACGHEALENRVQQRHRGSGAVFDFAYEL